MIKVRAVPGDSSHALSLRTGRELGRMARGSARRDPDDMILPRARVFDRPERRVLHEGKEHVMPRS